jgi:hypothetical protein
MLAADADKEQQLRDAGIITGEGPLPEEYASVVASLTSDEIETLISVRQRLELAAKASGQEIDAHMVAP